MNKILLEIQGLVKENIEKYLPDVDMAELEGQGALFYMNGKNGTEFDWYVNERLSDFFVFYKDEKNLGAVKAHVYRNGAVVLYVYGDHGEELLTEVETEVNVSADELLELAVMLTKFVDEKRVWDSDIEKLELGQPITKEMKEAFLANETYYHDMIEQRAMMSQFAYVSRRILEDGFNVGYMTREEATQEGDSGWCFMSGEESDDYVEDYHNIALMHVGEVTQLDRAVWPHITSPVGSAFIRISEDEMEEDHRDKKIYISKRK